MRTRPDTYFVRSQRKYISIQKVPVDRSMSNRELRLTFTMFEDDADDDDDEVDEEVDDDKNDFFQLRLAPTSTSSTSSTVRF